MAMDLKLNLTTCLTILKSLDINQTEEQITNQLLDLYYQESPPENENKMVTPNMLLRSFSQKITTPNDNKSSIHLKPSSSFNKTLAESHHVVIEIEKSSQQTQNFCPICYEITANLISLSCGHKFCQDCLLGYFRAKIMSSQIRLFKCPEEKCLSNFEEGFIQSFLEGSEPNLWLKYQKFKQKEEIAKDPNKKWCIKPGCEQIIIRDSLQVNYGKCFMCGQEVCFKCGNQWHPNEGCAEAMDEVFKEYLKGVDSKPCPKCHQIIEKSVGCNVMACPYCRFTFCWLCSREYKIGHFSIFNINGCPGMDGTEIRGELTTSRRYWECVKGVLGFILKMLLYLVIGILIYPFLMIFCIIFLLKEHVRNGGRVSCDKANGKKVCCLILFGVFLGICSYITYPIGFLLMFCYMCFWNPHVAYPYAERGRVAANQPRQQERRTEPQTQPELPPQSQNPIV